jgi:glycerophosphoryl diester phosphodiesterase
MRLFPSLLLLTGLALGRTREIVVISHRGEHLQHPENTLPAYQAAIDAGADYFEVDVQTTADGKLVLMHDSTVNRRTTAKGKIAEMTFAQVRALDAGIKSGEAFRNTRVPTFEEALALAHRHQAGIYVDNKHASAADIVTAIRKAHMTNRVVIYAGLKILQEVQRLDPRIKLMPEADSAELLRQTVAAIHPQVVAFDARDFTGEIIAIARQAGAGVFVDRLGPADNPAIWQDAIDRGATGIQTDRPADLVQYLRSKALHK